MAEERVVNNRAAAVCACGAACSIGTFLTIITVVPREWPGGSGTVLRPLPWTSSAMHWLLSRRLSGLSVSAPGSISSGGLYLAPSAAKGLAVIKAKVVVNGLTLPGTVTVNIV